MLRFISRRLAGLVVIWTLTLIITFLAVHAMPGDPVSMMLADHAGDPGLAAKLRADYGLDRSLPGQLLAYLAGIADGSFGLSYRFVGATVFSVIGHGLAITPLLALGALVLAVPIGLVCGVFAASRPNSWADATILLALVGLISLPSFALAALLVWLLALKLEWLPVAGWGTPAQAVLPLVVLTAGPAAVIARMTRTHMLEILGRDFIRTARAKGVRARRVIWRHALGNALVPVITSIGVIFGGLLSGAFVVEVVFNIPGLGRIAVDSILARDYPVAMAAVLVFTVFYSLVNLATDLVCVWIDPRIRLS